MLRALGFRDDRLLTPSRSEFDLRAPHACRRLFQAARPSDRPLVVVHAAAISGGLAAIRRDPDRFFHENRAMALNLIDEALLADLPRHGGAFVQLGHLSVYPPAAPQPYSEDSLFSGPLEPDLATYGQAKLDALRALQSAAGQHGLRAAYLIPTNLYGPGDTLDPARAHAAGALMVRIVDAALTDAPEVVCWGTGSPTRDFLHVQDAARGVVAACGWIIGQPHAGVTPMNLSSGSRISIRELANLVADAAGYRGRVVFDHSRPDGQARRALDPSRARQLLGWTASISLQDGVRQTVQLLLATRGSQRLN